MEGEMFDSFDRWMRSLPRWLQTAAADLLVGKKMPDDSEVVALADLCIAEGEGHQAHFSPFPAGALTSSADTTPMRICGIEALRDVNALDRDACLDFGDASLSVVYGSNGSGKSGFARVTKCAASGRTPSSVIPNVFSGQVTEPSADFIIESVGTKERITWNSAGGPITALRRLQVFDTEIANSYIAEMAEASHEPFRLRFLTRLVKVCDRTKIELEERKKRLRSAMPRPPADLAGTVSANYVGTLEHSVTPDHLRQRLALPEGYAERRKILLEALQTPDPAVKSVRLKKNHSELKVLQSKLGEIAGAITNEQVKKIAKARLTSLNLRRAAESTAAIAFGRSSLAGVGEETWRIMWEAARTYSEKVAYSEHSFPHTGPDARCPLCQQGLGVEARERLLSFEEFIQGEVEARAKQSEEEHERLIQELPVLPSLEDWRARFASVPDTEDLASKIHTALSMRLAPLPQVTIPAEVPDADLAPLRRAVEVHQSVLMAELALLEESQKEGERARLEAEIRELRMLEWCQENLEAILSELERLGKVAVLDRAMKLTNTAKLTKKKNELAESDLTKGYQERFLHELELLGAGRIRVKPVEAKKAKGRVHFKLAMIGAKREVSPKLVLSEGEARIVSLASFLADVTVAGSRTPFLFDDPISSLDIDFEERVVARLVSLSKTRQVVVFTHRLSLLSLLREAVSKERAAAKHIESKDEVKWKEIALRRLGGRIGLVTETNVLESKVDKALRDIADRRLAQAQRVAAERDYETYSSLMKAICSDVRILVERTVEEELLSNVVKRFRRSIVTKDKLTLLPKIEVNDCVFLDNMMTRFSCFEHSQPQELPMSLPAHELVLKDVTALRDWILRFRKRVVLSARSGGQGLSI